MGEHTGQPGDREFDLDPFRGLVCVWLMGLHLCYMSEAHPALLRLVGPGAAEALYHLRLGVESFLVLAGFMTAHMLRPVPGEAVRTGAYLARRGYRLLLPYGAAVVLAAADKWVAHLLFGGGQGRPGPGAVAAQLLLVNEFFGVPEPAVGYWSMATLEQFYLLWVGCFALVRWAGGLSTGAASRMGPLALGVVLGSGWAFLFLGPETLNLVRFAFYIALGFLLYGRVRLGLYRWESAVAVAAVAGATVWFQHSRLLAALLTCGVLSALARGYRFPRWGLLHPFHYVGRRAYSVYLVHAVVGLRLLSGYRFAADRFGDWAAVPAVVAAAGASLAGAAMFYRLIERPCQELARRVRYRRPAARVIAESDVSQSSGA